MKVETLELGFLLFFHWNAIRVRPGILANSRHLPGHFDAGQAGSDLELVVLDLLRDYRLCKLTDDGELVAEIPVEHIEPIWQRDSCQTGAVCGDVAVVNVHHVRRFDEGVVEVLIGRIERVIDMELSTCFGKFAVDVDIAVEKRRVAPALVIGEQGVTCGGVAEASAAAAGTAGLPFHAICAPAAVHSGAAGAVHSVAVAGALHSGGGAGAVHSGGAAEAFHSDGSAAVHSVGGAGAVYSGTAVGVHSGIAGSVHSDVTGVAIHSDVTGGAVHSVTVRAGGDDPAHAPGGGIGCCNRGIGT